MNASSPSGTAPAVLDKYLVFVFGVLFISVLLWLVFRTDAPLTEDQARLVHLVSALAAAGFGAALPGRLQVRHRWLLRASGSLALFVLVYVFQPERAVTPPGVWPKTDPSRVVEDHLRLTDAGRYGEAYDALSPEGKKRFSRDEVIEVFRTHRTPFGDVEKRVRNGVSSVATLPDGTVGPFKLYAFVTTFKDGNRVHEPIWVMAVDKNTWGVLFHNVFPCLNNQCGNAPETP